MVGAVKNTLAQQGVNLVQAKNLIKNPVINTLNCLTLGCFASLTWPDRYFSFCVGAGKIGSGTLPIPKLF